MSPQPAPDRFGPPWRYSGDTDQHPTPPGMGGASPITVPYVAPRGVGAPIDRGAAAAERARQDRLTRTVPVIGSGVVPVSGPAVIDCGGPNQGYAWDLKRLMVGPVDLTVLPWASGVTTLLFLRGQNAADTSASNALSTTQAWPAQGTWSRHEAHLEFGQRVVAVVLGLTAGTVVTVGGAAEQTATDVELRWSD